MAQQPPERTGTIQCVLFPAPQVLPSLPLFLEEGGCLKDVTLFGCVVGTVQVCSIEVLQAALQGPVWTKLRSEWSCFKTCDSDLQLERRGVCPSHVWERNTSSMGKQGKAASPQGWESVKEQGDLSLHLW